MIPFVRSFARLAIRLLIAIYRESRYRDTTCPMPFDHDLVNEAKQWLERNKPI